MNQKLELVSLKTYKFCNNRLDLSKAEKILGGIERGYITKENYWDYVVKYTKNIKAETSLDRWKAISKFIYINYYMN